MPDEQTGFEPVPDIPLPGMPEAPERPFTVTRCRPRIVLEAVQLTSDADWRAIAEWCDATLGEQGTLRGLVPAVRVWTGNGSAWAMAGDWITRGTHAFGVWTPEQFAAAYEVVTEAHDA